MEKKSVVKLAEIEGHRRNPPLTCIHCGSEHFYPEFFIPVCDWRPKPADGFDIVFEEQKKTDQRYEILA